MEKIKGSSNNSPLCDKLNVMASIHNRKIIAALVKELKQRESILEQLEKRIVSLENKLNDFRAEVKQKNEELITNA
jgi:uncharacterized protein YlxW (UPF0749 family)